MARKKRGTGFWECMTVTETGCWEWQGCRYQNYGQVRVNGKLFRTHRLAFELTYGYLPEVVCHRCDNPPCCNPAHLFGGSHADNVSDRIAKGRSRYSTLRGEQGPGCKITAADVIEIRARYDAGELSQTQLGKLYGITQSQVHLIVRRKEWTHI